MRHNIRDITLIMGSLVSIYYFHCLTTRRIFVFFPPCFVKALEHHTLFLPEVSFTLTRWWARTSSYSLLRTGCTFLPNFVFGDLRHGGWFTKEIKRTGSLYLKVHPIYITIWIISIQHVSLNLLNLFGSSRLPAFHFCCSLPRARSPRCNLELIHLWGINPKYPILSSFKLQYSQLIAPLRSLYQLLRSLIHSFFHFLKYIRTLLSILLFLISLVPRYNTSVNSFSLNPFSSQVNQSIPVTFVLQAVEHNWRSSSNHRDMCIVL